MMRVCSALFGAQPGGRFSSGRVGALRVRAFMASRRAAVRMRESRSIILPLLHPKMANCIASQLRSCRDRPCAQVMPAVLKLRRLLNGVPSSLYFDRRRVGSVKDADVGADLVQDLGDLAWDDIWQAIRHSSGSRGRFLLRTSPFRC